MLKKVLITGIARNCSSTLENDFLRINAAFKSSCIVKWLIVESDSTDNSPQVLKKLQLENPSLDYITLGEISIQIPERTDRLAFCRNKYIEELVINEKYDDIEYVIVVDLDGVNSLISEKSVETCWKYPGHWDVCCANQRHAYYDIWALRHKYLSPNDCLLHRDFLVNLGLSEFASEYAGIYSRMIEIPINSGWIEVDSAFGGLAIYRKAVLSKVRYQGRNVVGDIVCEHVPLHEQIKKQGGSIFINSELINGGFNEHSYRKISWFRWCVIFFKKVLKKFQKNFVLYTF